MAWNKPIPEFDEDLRSFWDALKEHRFVLFRCQRCGAWYWPAAFCRNHENAPFFGDMIWEDASGKGTVFSFNIHNVAFHPGFAEDVPYAYALVELNEGPMIGSTIIGCPVDEVRVGMSVEVVFEDVNTEQLSFTLPRFRPAVPRVQ